MGGRHRHWWCRAQHLQGGGQHGGALGGCHHVHVLRTSTDHMPIPTLKPMLYPMPVLARVKRQQDGSAKHAAGNPCLRLLLPAGRPVRLSLLFPPQVPLHLVTLARAPASSKSVRSVSSWCLGLPRISTALSPLHQEGGKD